MSGKRARRIYWDTCVFLAWIKQETVWPEEVTKGIEQTIELAKSKQVVIATSALTIAEALATQVTLEQKQRFRHIFSVSYLQLIDLDRRISEKASVIRDYYDTRQFKAGVYQSGSSMAMGDAIHLATAIHFNMDEFQTLDGAGKRPRRTDILNLDGDVAGSRLNIKRPKFVPPPEPLEGPQQKVSGLQPGLFENQESGKGNEAATTTTEQNKPESA